jgi:hypothetical protein
MNDRLGHHCYDPIQNPRLFPENIVRGKWQDEKEK